MFIELIKLSMYTLTYIRVLLHLYKKRTFYFYVYKTMSNEIMMMLSQKKKINGETKIMMIIILNFFCQFNKIHSISILINNIKLRSFIII